MLMSQNVMIVLRIRTQPGRRSEHSTAELAGPVRTAPHCPCIPNSLCATDPILQTDTMRAKKTGFPRYCNTCTTPCRGPDLNDALVMGADPASGSMSTPQKLEEN